MSSPKVAVLDLTSGFTIRVKPLPPYYNDFIEDALPLKPLPRRKLHLAAGDTLDVEYIKPESFPDDSSERELYVLYVTAEDENKAIEVQRQKYKINFLINNCIEVVDGPCKLTDPEWVAALERSLPNYKVPVDPGLRYVAFVKTQVITTQVEMDEILTSCMFPEVNMQGIVNALLHFPDNLPGGIPVGGNRTAAGGG